MFNVIRSLNPYLFYTFDEGPATTTVIDRSGNGRNGTNTASAVAVLQAAPGHGIRSAYGFDGSDSDHITTNITTNFTTEFSFCALIYPTSTPADRDTIWSKNSYYATGTSDFPISLFRNSSGEISFALDSGGNFSADVTLNSGIAAPLNKWTFVAGVYRANGECSLWQNDEKAIFTNIAFTVSSNSRNWVIGRESAPNGGGVGQSGFNGRITYPALWNRALSDFELTALSQSWLWNAVVI